MKQLRATISDSWGYCRAVVSIKGENCTDCLVHRSFSGNGIIANVITHMGYIRNNHPSDTLASLMCGPVFIPILITYCNTLNPVFSAISLPTKNPYNSKCPIPSLLPNIFL